MALRLSGIVVGVVVCALLFLAGFYCGHRIASDAGALREARKLADAQQTLRQHYEQELTAANAQVVALRDQKRQIAATAAQLQRRINDVSRPDCDFTVGFGRLYNRAIGASVPAVDIAPGAAGAPGATDTPDTAISPLTQSDILWHITDYGQQCQRTDAQLNRLIDYLEGINESRTAP